MPSNQSDKNLKQLQIFFFQKKKCNELKYIFYRKTVKICLKEMKCYDLIISCEIFVLK